MYPSIHQAVVAWPLLGLPSVGAALPALPAAVVSPLVGVSGVTDPLSGVLGTLTGARTDSNRILSAVTGLNGTVQQVVQQLTVIVAEVLANLLRAGNQIATALPTILGMVIVSLVAISEAIRVLIALVDGALRYLNGSITDALIKALAASALVVVLSSAVQAFVQVIAKIVSVLPAAVQTTAQQLNGTLNAVLAGLVATVTLLLAAVPWSG